MASRSGKVESILLNEVKLGPDLAIWVETAKFSITYPVLRLWLSKRWMLMRMKAFRIKQSSPIFGNPPFFRPWSPMAWGIRGLDPLLASIFIFGIFAFSLYLLDFLVKHQRRRKHPDWEKYASKSLTGSLKCLLVYSSPTRRRAVRNMHPTWASTSQASKAIKDLAVQIPTA